MTFGVIALCLFLAETIFFVPVFLGQWDSVTALWAAALCCSLAIYGVAPRAGGILVIGIAFLDAAWPSGTTFSSWAAYFVIGDLIVRRRYLPAFTSLAAIELTVLIRAEGDWSYVPTVLLGSGITIAIAFVVQNQVAIVARLNRSAENSKQEARMARHLVEEQLAANLHDTVARDLVHIMLLSRDLASGVIDSGSAIVEIESSSREALTKLRSLRSGSAPAIEGSIREAIAAAERLLRSHRIMLNVELDEQAENRLTEDQRNVLNMCIAEAAINIVKYAPCDTTAELNLTVGNTVVALALSNEIAESPRPDSEIISSNSGLRNTAGRVEMVGGTCYQWHFGTSWVFSVELPLLRSSSPEAAGTTPEREYDL